MSLPRVFLSSTIFDFADLRSAIKYWLEESGYEVAASEFNDFPKDVEQNSYEACLASIDTCQYFVLLIGTRAGGRVASPANTTITMAEYRRAYERAKNGQLKVIALVRRSVWNAREDRNALFELIKSSYQQEHGLSAEDVSNIKHHASKIVVDAEIVFSFISEVARAPEMKAASKDAAAPLPINNWVHQFETFRDVVDVLRTSFVRDGSLRRAALLASLRDELCTNLAAIVERMDGALVPHYRWSRKARAQFSGGPDDTSTICEFDLKCLGIFAYTLRTSLLTHALDGAIESGEFLHYDVAEHRYTIGEVQEALLLLRKAIAGMKSIAAGFLSTEKRVELLDFKNYNSKTAKVAIPNVRIGPLILLHDQTKDATNLSLALLRWIETGKYVEPELAPMTPFGGHEEQIRAERPSVDELVKYAVNGAGAK